MLLVAFLSLSLSHSPFPVNAVSARILQKLYSSDDCPLDLESFSSSFFPCFVGALHQQAGSITWWTTYLSIITTFYLTFGTSGIRGSCEYFVEPKSLINLRCLWAYLSLPLSCSFSKFLPLVSSFERRSHQNTPRCMAMHSKRPSRRVVCGNFRRAQHWITKLRNCSRISLRSSETKCSSLRVEWRRSIASFNN